MTERLTPERIGEKCPKCGSELHNTDRDVGYGQHQLIYECGSYQYRDIKDGALHEIHEGERCLRRQIAALTEDCRKIAGVLALLHDLTAMCGYTEHCKAFKLAQKQVGIDLTPLLERYGEVGK